MSIIEKIFNKSIQPKESTEAIFAVEIMGKDDELIIFHRGLRYLLSINKKGELSLLK